jgi:hypothetical protein
VDVHESYVRTTTHENLVLQLAGYAVPSITRQADIGIGDVAFGSADGGLVLFARANLVVLVRNATPTVFPVAEIARRFDESLVSAPVPAEGEDAPQIHRFDVSGKSVEAGKSVPLEIEAVDPLERPLWFKFFAPTGEVFRDVEGQLAYRPAAAGPQRITGYAINSDGGAATQALQFDAL